MEDARFQELLEQSRIGLVGTRLEDPGVLLAQGGDWLEFLDRISTNALKDLRDGQARETLLTNALGRLIDRLWVIRLGHRGLLLTAARKQEEVQSWLRQYIFFRDDVQVEPASLEAELWALLGPDVPDFLSAAYPDVGDEVLASEKASNQVITWPIETPARGWMVFLPAERAGPLHQLSDQLGADARPAYDYLRLRAGLIDTDNEVLPKSTPLELGMGHLIDFEKGCYIGQEVIARMESRGQVPRRLFQFDLDREEAPGSAIEAGDRQIGILLETAKRPGDGYLGLALVRVTWMSQEPIQYRIGDQSIELEPVAPINSPNKTGAS